MFVVLLQYTAITTTVARPTTAEETTPYVTSEEVSPTSSTGQMATTAFDDVIKIGSLVGSDETDGSGMSKLLEYHIITVIISICLRSNNRSLYKIAFSDYGFSPKAYIFFYISTLLTAVKTRYKIERPDSESRVALSLLRRCTRNINPQC